MAFGGTNFGLTAGANGFSFPYEYLPHITSYDYDCPITEQGRPTSRYHAIRNIMQQNSGKILMQIPQPIPTLSMKNTFRPELKSFLWANLPEPTLRNANLTYF